MSTDRRMDKDVIHIYNRLRAIKGNKIMPFAVMRMYIETDILTEVKSDRERIITWYCLYVGSFKNGTNKLFNKT